MAEPAEDRDDEPAGHLQFHKLFWLGQPRDPIADTDHVVINYDPNHDAYYFTLATDYGRYNSGDFTLDQLLQLGLAINKAAYERAREQVRKTHPHLAED